MKNRALLYFYPKTEQKPNKTIFGPIIEPVIKLGAHDQYFKFDPPLSIQSRN